MVHASYVVLHPAIPMPMPPIKTLCYSLGNGYVYAKHGRTRHAVWAVVKALVRAVVSTGASRRASGIRAAALLGGYLAYRRPCDDVVGEHQ
jgi:hypothetical protein